MKIKNIKKRTLNVLSFFLFALSYYFFFLSLEKCFEGEDICCMKFSWMKKKIIEESISCIITIILLELIIIKKISKLHVIHFLIVFTLFYNYSNGIDFNDHGYYNIKYFFVIVLSILILLFFLKILLSVKKKKIITLLIEILVILFYLLSQIIYNSNGCDDWAMGLNNTSIDNDKNKYNCLIHIPKSCYYKIGKYFLDKNKFFPLNCIKNGLNSRERIISNSKSPFINKNSLHIGFPLINKDEKFMHDMNLSTFRSYVYDNYIDMNNSTLINLLRDKKPEISVDFSNNTNGDMKINLNFNKTLSYERKKSEISSDPYSKNI